MLRRVEDPEDIDILNKLVGQKLLEVKRDKYYEGKITMVFENSTTIVIDAEGDDMAHTVLYLKENN